jgi:hypothetical protein
MLVLLGMPQLDAQQIALTAFNGQAFNQSVMDALEHSSSDHNQEHAQLAVHNALNAHQQLLASIAIMDII